MPPGGLAGYPRLDGSLRVPVPRGAADRTLDASGTCGRTPA
jgi:hypothetical protein